jgi:hypothetical protein
MPFQTIAAMHASFAFNASRKNDLTTRHALLDAMRIEIRNSNQEIGTTLPAASRIDVHGNLLRQHD